VDNLLWEWGSHYIFHIECLFIWKWCRLWCLAACGLTVCIGALMMEGFVRWVATSAKLSWNSHCNRSLHSHWCESIAWKLLSFFAFLGSFISQRWISSCRANGIGCWYWRHYKFKPYFRLVSLWTVLSCLVFVTEKTSGFYLMVGSQCCQWTWKLVGRHSHRSMRFWALGESFSVRRRRRLCGCLGSYRQTTHSGKDQRLKCGLNKSLGRMNHVGSSKPDINAHLQAKRTFNETCQSCPS